MVLCAAFDHLSGADSRLVWQELRHVIPEGMTLLYLSPDPLPKQFP